MVRFLRDATELAQQPAQPPEAGVAQGECSAQERAQGAQEKAQGAEQERGRTGDQGAGGWGTGFASNIPGASGHAEGEVGGRSREAAAGGSESRGAISGGGQRGAEAWAAQAGIEGNAGQRGADAAGRGGNPAGGTPVSPRGRSAGGGGGGEARPGGASASGEPGRRGGSGSGVDARMEVSAYANSMSVLREATGVGGGMAWGEGLGAGAGASGRSGGLRGIGAREEGAQPFSLTFLTSLFRRDPLRTRSSRRSRHAASHGEGGPPSEAEQIPVPPLDKILNVPRSVASDTAARAAGIGSSTPPQTASFPGGNPPLGATFPPNRTYHSPALPSPAQPSPSSADPHSLWFSSPYESMGARIAESEVAETLGRGLVGGSGRLWGGGLPGGGEGRESAKAETVGCVRPMMPRWVTPPRRLWAGRGGGEVAGAGGGGGGGGGGGRAQGEEERGRANHAGCGQFQEVRAGVGGIGNVHCSFLQMSQPLSHPSSYHPTTHR
ncbi:unnamed protein product [Closterium sp. Naga37s-1]|nr:unnamed protein product [Closterium sp. Naga37s-1]